MYVVELTINSDIPGKLQTAAKEWDSKKDAIEHFEETRNYYQKTLIEFFDELLAEEDSDLDKSFFKKVRANVATVSHNVGAILDIDGKVFFDAHDNYFKFDLDDTYIEIKLFEKE